MISNILVVFLLVAICYPWSAAVSKIALAALAALLATKHAKASDEISEPMARTQTR